jgi:sugar lactone lactonase YvrE
MRLQRGAVLAFAALACVLTVGGAARSAELKRLQEFRYDEEKMPGLLCAGRVYLHGEFVYVNGIFPCKISVFRRDAATGRVKYEGIWDYDPQFRPMNKPKASQHKFLHAAFGANGLVYVTGSTFHAAPNSRFGRSYGLHWYRVDPKTGMGKHLGSMKVGHGSLMTARKGKVLYQFEQYPEAIHWYTIAADGKPVHGGEVKGKGLVTDGNFAKPGRVPAAISPDEKFLYSVSARDMAVGWASVAQDGALKYGGSIDVRAPLKLEIEENKDTYTGFRAGGLSIPADGKNLYLAYAYRRATLIAVFARDAGTGELKFRETLELGKSMKARAIGFRADGLAGFYVTGARKDAGAVGGFTRDPATGRLTAGAEFSASKDFPVGHMAVDPSGKVCYVSDNGGHKSGGLHVLRLE